MFKRKREEEIRCVCCWAVIGCCRDVHLCGTSAGVPEFTAVMSSAPVGPLLCHVTRGFRQTPPPRVGRFFYVRNQIRQKSGSSSGVAGDEGGWRRGRSQGPPPGVDPLLALETLRA